MSLTKKKPLILKEGVRWKQKILFFNRSSLLFARLVHKSSCHFIGNSINTVWFFWQESCWCKIPGDLIQKSWGVAHEISGCLFDCVSVNIRVWKNMCEFYMYVCNVCMTVWSTCKGHFPSTAPYLLLIYIYIYINVSTKYSANPRAEAQNCQKQATFYINTRLITTLGSFLLRIPGNKKHRDVTNEVGSPYICLCCLSFFSVMTCCWGLRFVVCCDVFCFVACRVVCFLVLGWRAVFHFHVW